MSTTIREIKHTLDGRQQQFACELLQQSPDTLVVRHDLKQQRRLHTVHLPKNTITIAYFWQHRPYNLYHFLRFENGVIADLAFYFNIGDRIEWRDDTLSWRDLTVDVLVAPERKPVVLDREQLPADLAEDLQAFIAAATQAVLKNHTEIIARAKKQSATLLGH